MVTRRGQQAVHHVAHLRGTQLDAALVGKLDGIAPG